MKKERTHRSNASPGPSPSRKREPKPAAKSFPIVGIGASAGGLEAFSQLLASLPSDTGMGFVVVQHLDPNHESALVKILSRHTSMLICEAANNLAVLPNHIYVIPPNTDMTIVCGVLKLQIRKPGRAPHHSIDFFFESLALDQGEFAVGVILSGTASDGTSGMELIKAEGGITLAQDDSAAYGDMPRSAIAGGCVDFVLSPQAIARELAMIAKHPCIADKSSPGQTSKSKAGASTEETIGQQSGFKKILLLLRSHSKTDFSLYKPNTIQRRIKRRMVLNKVSTLEEYAKFIRGKAKELDALYSDMLISVTGFFRNPQAFEALKRDVFPRLMEQPRDRPLRVWSLGCSSGQEVYSLAMAFLDFFQSVGQERKLQFFATDINEAVLAKARDGFYAKSLVQDLSPEQLRRFFVEETNGYRIAKFIREMIVFSRHDLLSDPPFSRIHLISCRNLMIYLEPDVQEKILPTFHYALHSGGFLFLGESESVGRFEELFHTTDRKNKIFSRTAGYSPLFFFAARHPTGDNQKKAVLPADPARGLPSQSNVLREADRVTLNRYAPAGVLINAQSQILQFRGETSAFLKPPRGNASLHVLKMAREGLLPPLRSALKEAKEGNKTVRREGLHMSENGAVKTVNMEVMPLTHLSEQCYLIFFEDEKRPIVGQKQQPVQPPSPPPVSSLAETRKDQNQRVRDLEHELSETRDYTQSLQEQSEAANEELQASNEEVTSANEELQSINEELETSKEELESTNEELVTVNEELGVRNAELGRLNADLNNLQTSIHTAILLLGRDLTIRRFTPLAEKMFNLRADDVGRPLSHLRHNLGLVDLESMLKKTIETPVEHSCEAQDEQGRWYSVRARPYMTLENKIDGVLLLLVDIDALKRSEQKLKIARDYAEAILRTSRGPLVVLRSDLRVDTANDAFYKTFKTTPEETEGQSFFELSDGAWQMPKLQKLLEEILPRNSFFTDFEVSHNFPLLGQRVMWLDARPMLNEKGSPPMIVLAIEDVTDLRASEAALREIVGELEAFSYSIAHDLRAPLRSMQGFADLLLREAVAKLNATEIGYLQRMAKSSVRMDKLIQDVLNYSKVVRGQVTQERVDTDSLTREIIENYPDVKAVGNIHIAGSLPPVVANQAVLTQCISNLIGNALKFVSPGTTPRVTISSEERRDEQNQAGKEGESSFVRIWFADNGIGIASENYARIFQMLERINPVATPMKGLASALPLCVRGLSGWGAITEWNRNWEEEANSGSN